MGLEIDWDESILAALCFVVLESGAKRAQDGQQWVPIVLGELFTGACLGALIGWLAMGRGQEISLPAHGAEGVDTLDALADTHALELSLYTQRFRFVIS